MKKTMIVVLLAFFSAANSFPSVWAISDMVKINPQTATVYESGKLYSTPMPEGYKTGNAVWSEARNKVTLRGLKDEVVAFQVVVEDTSSFVVDKVELKGLGRNINHELYVQWFMNVTEPSFNVQHWIFSFGKGWYPSHLIPFASPDIKKEFALPLNVPHNRNNIPVQKCAVFWIDLHVTRQASAKMHSGVLEIIVNGLKRKIKIDLKVEPVTIPGENHSNFIAVSQQARNYYVKSPEMARGLYHIFHAHRTEFVPYQWYMETEGKGSDLNIFWDRHIYNELPHLGSVNFDRDMLPFMKGTAYTAANGYVGPASGIPPAWISLPQAYGWFTRKGISYPSAEYDSSFVASCRLTARKYSENGLTQKRMGFIIKADEPKSFEELSIGKHHADLFHSGFSESGFGYHYRMDGVSFGERSAKRFKEGWTRDSTIGFFDGKVTIWSQVANEYAFPLVDTTIDYLKLRYGGEYWICHTNTSGEPGTGAYPLDCEALGVINWPWILWKYRLDGGMFWEAFFYLNTDSLWNNPLAYEVSRKPDLAFINGDGGMVYPGDYVLDTNRFIPGVKLKHIRRGQQDYEYLYLLAELCGSRAKADSIVSTVLYKALWDAKPPEVAGNWDKHAKGEIDPEFNYMKGKWSHNPDDWYRARMAVLDEIIKNRLDR